MTTTTKFYTKNEEIANAATHGFGVLMAIVSGWYLINKAAESEHNLAVFTVLVYLFGILFSYGSSTFYHAAPVGKRKALLRKFDHAAIYVHIAGTYTPFTLIALREYDWWGYGLFAFVWFVTIIGVILSFIRLKEHSHLETVCYVAMGACVIVAMKTLWTALSAINPMIFFLLIGGGISFIVGAVCYSLHKARYMHTLFHLFCLGGSIGHILAICYLFDS